MVRDTVAVDTLARFAISRMFIDPRSRPRRSRPPDHLICLVPNIPVGFSSTFPCCLYPPYATPAFALARRHRPHLPVPPLQSILLGKRDVSRDPGARAVTGSHSGTPAKPSSIKGKAAMPQFQL